MTGLLGLAAATGFFALLAAPALFVTSAAVRAVLAAWRPDELARSLVDDSGAAPRLAGWVAVVWLGVVGLGWAGFESIWLLAQHTAFRPLPMSFFEPILMIAAVLAMLAVSRPAARMFAWLAGKLDARWRRTGRRTLLRPRIIFAVAIATLLAGVYALWRWYARPRLGPIDTSLLHAPAVGLAVTGLVHLAWQRAPRARRIGGPLLAAATVAVFGAAIAARYVAPSLTLEIWGDEPIAGLGIESLFQLDAIRASIALDEFRPTDRPGATPPDIILVTIDTVRADHTPPYGGHAEMPILSQLAQRGTVFTWAFAPSNVTRRSIPSMMIGLAPNRVHGRVVGWALRVDPRHVMLAERMRAGGYETAGFMCCEGFWGKEFHTGLERGLAHLEIEPHGLVLARRARDWIAAREKQPHDKPLFVWMHILEPHNWTQLTGEPRNDEERKHFYDRSLQLSDQMLFELTSAFGSRPPDKMPIVIVTADHGEALGEHGQPFHSTDLYNSQVRVPFVIAGPGIKAQTVPETVSLTDLVPTVLELAGFVPSTGASLDGHSLADLATGRRAGNPDDGVAFSAMIKDRSNPGGITAVVKGRWKLIDNNGNLELYDTRADPDEHANVNGQHPGIATELKKLLDERVAKGDESPF